MRGRVSLLASIVCLGLAGMAFAQVATVEGTVVSSSGSALVIDTGSGQQTFMVDAQSSVPDGLAAGTRVKVEFHTLANNQLHAFKVSPLGGSATTTTTTTTTTTPATTPATTDTPPAGTAAPETRETTETAPLDTTPPAASEPVRTEPARSATEPARVEAETDPDTGRRLPATASPLPLLALAGGLSIAGAMLIRRRRS